MKKDNNQIEILVNQFNTQNYNHVIVKCLQLIKKNPSNILLYNLLGSSYQNIGDFFRAKEVFKEGLKIDSQNLAIINNLGMAYKNLLNYKKSEKLFREIIQKNSNYINAYVNLGNLKRDINQFDEAIKLYELALEISNKNPIILYSLALAYQGIGEFEKAIKYANLTLKINEKFTRADYLISQSMKYSNNHFHYLKLKEKIKDISLNDNDKIELYFSLAKAEEDIGNIDLAYEYLDKGNNLKNKLIGYNIKNEIKLFEQIKKCFAEVNFENNTVSDDKIIFILGMPRSGTSLVEQIITSHSEVFGGGELPILSNIIKNKFTNNGNFSEEKLIKTISNKVEIDILKKIYTDYIAYFNYKEKYITDKAPLNFRWIGFIKIIFPNAKIIHCSRDAKDNCLSMFKNLFEGGLNFTYNQNNLVEYYKNYLELMKYWKSFFNDDIYEIKYENLIKNNEEEIKKIIKFCNLNWEDNCLSFYKNKTPIKTMSTAQARNPIYKSSMKSFEKYKKYLNILDNNL